MITCKEFIEDFLADYTDGSLRPEVIAELEAHLAACRACVAYLNTYKRTPEVVGSLGRVEMPSEMQEILRRFVRSRLGKSTD